MADEKPPPTTPQPTELPRPTTPSPGKIQTHGDEPPPDTKRLDLDDRR
jgi:hypothetical protein